jgi:ParB-like chromosome segregation protein Spo0J
VHSRSAVIPACFADVMAQGSNIFREVIGEPTSLPASPGCNGFAADNGISFSQAVVRISDLCRTGSPRSTGIDPAHVHRLVEATHSLPPIVVYRPTMQVIDGFHRVAAAVHVGRTELEAYLFEGSPDAAFILAVGANVTHGLPLTLADRRSAAARILATYPHLSDRSIASATGLSAKTIASTRNAAGDAVRLDKRLGKDGRLRPLNAAVGRALAAELMDAYPDASLRQIAAAAGVSPGTVRDVRARMVRGDDPSRAAAANRRPSITRVRNKSSRISTDTVQEPVDVLAVLQLLSRDPALRMNAAGRDLLRWLHGHVINTADCAKFVDDVPNHCIDHLVELAHRCATNWTRVAQDLQQRRATDTGLTAIASTGDLRTG